jgi:putative two-component system response regulator
MLNAQRPKILIVDDNPRNAAIIEGYIRPHYDTIKAYSGEECLEIIEKEAIDLVILDVILPGINGYDVCKRIKGNKATKHIPVILIPALPAGHEKIRSVQVGAEDFIDRPFGMNEVVARVKAILKIKDLYSDLERINDALLHTIHALSRAAESNDDVTGKHILRVSRYSMLLSKELGLPEEFVHDIGIAAQTHDVGKIHIHPDILRKPAKLTSTEFEIIKQHPIYGARILGEHPKLKMAHIISLTHHECWDGSGYPYGLKGEIIPIEGRIIKIVDQYDALRSLKPYRPSYNHSKACRIISEGDGKTMPYHFDPRVLKTFESVAGQMENIYDELKG